MAASVAVLQSEEKTPLSPLLSTKTSSKKKPMVTLAMNSHPFKNNYFLILSDILE